MKKNNKLALGLGLGMIVGSILGFITGNFALLGAGMLFGVAIATSFYNKTQENNKS